MAGYTNSASKGNMAILADKMSRFGNTDHDATENVSEGLEGTGIVSVRSKGPGKKISIVGLDQPDETRKLHLSEEGLLTNVVGTPDLIGINKQECLTEQSVSNPRGLHETIGELYRDEITEDFSVCSILDRKSIKAVDKVPVGQLPLKKRKLFKHDPYSKNRSTHEQIVKNDLQKLKLKIADTDDLPSVNNELKRLMENALELVLKNEIRITIGGVPHSVTASPIHPSGTGSAEEQDIFDRAMAYRRTIDGSPMFNGTIDRPPPACSVSSMASSSGVSEYGSDVGERLEDVGFGQLVRYDPEMYRDAVYGMQHFDPFCKPLVAQSYLLQQHLDDSEPLDLRTTPLAADVDERRENMASNNDEETMVMDNILGQNEDQMEPIQNETTGIISLQDTEAVGRPDEDMSQVFNQPHTLNWEHMSLQQRQLLILMLQLKQRNMSGGCNGSRPNMNGTALPQTAQVPESLGDFNISEPTDEVKCLPDLSTLELTRKDGSIDEKPLEIAKSRLKRQIKSRLDITANIRN